MSAGPILFSAAALTLVTVQVTLQKKSDRAKSRAIQTAAVQESAVPEKMLFLKFRDLSAAADKGDLAARIEMGRRFALGQGVRKNENRAAAYFQSVINEFGEIGSRDKRGPEVAAAYRYMARFYKTGISEANIAANPAYAFSMLHHAASYFGDPAAQVEIAKLLKSGDGVTKNTRAAAQWLLSASRKGFAPAQALLGELLWRGDGVTRVAGDGLGLLAIARRNASAADKAWVSKMFETARSEAMPIEILEANAFIVQESNVSRFGMANHELIAGENGKASAIAELEADGARSASPQSRGQQDSLIHGGSQALSELRANPMTFAPNSVDLRLTPESDEAKTSAGIIQMYYPHGHEARTEMSTPVRYAGVSK